MVVGDPSQPGGVVGSHWSKLDPSSNPSKIFRLFLGGLTTAGSSAFAGLLHTGLNSSVFRSEIPDMATDGDVGL